MVDIDAAILEIVEDAFGINLTTAETSQSPAVSEIEVTLAVVPVERLTADPGAIVEEVYSPTLPAAALSFVAVPGTCPVLARVYEVTSQFPEPRETARKQSLAAVVMLAAPGSIRLVALCVSVRDAANRPYLTTPAATVPKLVMVVVPVILTLFVGAAPIAQVPPEATSSKSPATSSLRIAARARI